MFAATLEAPPYVSQLTPSVAEAGPSVGWVSGADGVAVTLDGGRSWRLTLGTPAGEIDAVDARHVWALTVSGLVASRDGGASWQLLAHAPRLREVQFLDAAEGVGVSAHGSLAVTADGGASWRRTATPIDGDSACFASSRVGWVASPSGVRATDDGGGTWRTVLREPPGRFTGATVRCTARTIDVLFPDGVAAGSEGYAVEQSLDGGGHWRVLLEQFFPLSPAPPIDAYAGGFVVVDDRTSVFAGTCGPCGLGTMATVRTEARGRQLVRTARPVPGTYQASISFTDDRHGWMWGIRQALVAGKTGKLRAVDVLYRTADGGRRWTLLASGPRLAALHAR